MEKKTRSATCVVLGNCKYVDIGSLLNDPISGVPVRQAPTGISVVGRINHLVKQFRDGKRLSHEDAYKIVAEELIEIWLYGLNIYPLHETSVVSKIRLMFNGRKKTNNLAAVTGFKTLRDWPKPTPFYHQLVAEFNEKQRTGFDIRTYDQKRITELLGRKDEQGLPLFVKMTKEEECLHADNVKQRECECSWHAKVKCTLCPRQMLNSGKIDEKWKKRMLREQTDLISDKSREEEAKQNQARSQPVSVNILDEIYPDSTVMEPEDKDDTTFLPRFHLRDNTGMSKRLRSSQASSKSDESVTTHQEEKCPEVPLRFGRRSLNPKVMRALVHCQATYKVSDNDIEGIIVDVANLIFGQKWTKSNNFGKPDSNLEDVFADGSESEDEAVDPDIKKRRRVCADLTYQFPSRATRRRWLTHGSLLNLRYVAEKITSKKSNQVVTMAFDDTTKAAGRQVFDVKSTNITIDGEDMDRETYTTGFTPNLTHSGQNQAVTLRHNLQVLSILARRDGSDDYYTVDDLLQSFDFWMCDRSADGNILLDELNVDDDKRLKCCAHTTLAIDVAVESILVECEAAIGQDKLIDKAISSGSFQSKSSIITRGLIALSKAFSTSHASLTYSLYMTYKNWKEENGLNLEDFLGFKSNRFGRIAYLASTFLQQKDDLKRFFHEVIDEHSNHLFLALSYYIASDWFELGCRVLSYFGEKVIFPLCEILGIDKAKEKKRDDRNWAGMKEFYSTKLQELNDTKIEKQNGSSFDKLIAKCSEKVKDSLERQLNQMSFFSEDSIVSDETLVKMEHAPLTNSGCESRMAQLDVRVKFSGGSAPIETVSSKQIIAVNKYLTSPQCTEDILGADFKWARTSAEAKAALELQSDFLNQVKITQTLSLKAKQEAKSKRVQRAVKLALACQKHGGPLTAENVDLVENLSEKEILLEISYLKATVASEIKTKKRVKDPENPSKYKMSKFPITQLRISVRNVLKPDSGNLGSNMDDLLKQFLEKAQ